MNNAELVQDHHRARKAVIYIRQSTPHQVMTNVESRAMQRALRETAKRLGWDEARIELVESDTGVSARSTEGRDGYKNLLGLIAMGVVGLVLSYESARLSRNCTDWYPLLDLCAYARCLIADRDGVYDPSSPNGRLLLGMKGIVSEVELHTLRGRLLAGVQNKARRGELAVALPVGLVRLDDGRVVKNPDVHVQALIASVFATFLERRSVGKVVRHLNQQGVLLPRRHDNERTVWRPASVVSVSAILRNPAYAGAFAYGRTESVRPPGGAGPARQRRRALEDWAVLVHDRYPAYVPWETFLRIRALMRDNHADYRQKLSRGVARDGAALLHGILYCGECGRKMTVHYQRGPRYVCSSQTSQTGARVCQHVAAGPLDAYAVRAFFEALAPAELDVYARALQACRAVDASAERARARELERLRYEVHLARKQYDRVDPDNRLVAAELERRWEVALRALHEAEAKAVPTCDATDAGLEPGPSDELRAAFTSLGEGLPRLWRGDALTRAQRKSLLRCLIDKVVVRRDRRDRAKARVVWKGGAVSEADVPMTVGSVRDLSDFAALEARALELAAEGLSDAQAARRLTAEGFRSAQLGGVRPYTVEAIRARHGRRHPARLPCHVEGSLTVPELERALGIPRDWIYDQIQRGLVRAKRDPDTNVYLVDDTPETREQIRTLRKRLVPNPRVRR
ncbi:MAG TPA: recombinase family protein [Polyangiaceae bacterium]|nr:recombinase family protein [Polyangiaceae bacterium]